MTGECLDANNTNAFFAVIRDERALDFINAGEYSVNQGIADIGPFTVSGACDAMRIRFECVSGPMDLLRTCSGVVSYTTFTVLDTKDASSASDSSDSDSDSGSGIVLSTETPYKITISGLGLGSFSNRLEANSFFTRLDTSAAAARMLALLKKKNPVCKNT